MREYVVQIFLFLVFFSLLACSQKPIKEILTAPVYDEPIQAILIDVGKTFGPCEPSIDINPTDTDNMVAGSILDKVYVSNDGGYNWKKDKLKSTYGVYGDPVVRCDDKGVFYYAHLSNPGGGIFRDSSWLDRIVIQKSTDKGKTWNDGSFTLPRTPKDQDKQWLAMDPDEGNIYVTWTEFDLYNSKLPADKSRILFSKSIDQGESWSYPFMLSQFEGDCIDDDQTTEGAVPCVGTSGEVYVAWAFDEKIYFDRSFDQGQTWLDEDIVVTDQPGGWTFNIPGIFRCNGMPITEVDRSGGNYNGRIYVNWGDQRNGQDDTDIWIVYSDDKGSTWSSPTKVNNDNTNKHQFFSWMDVDQTTGFIYVVFYDRRNHDDKTTDVYLATSIDGGLTFSNVKINSESFIPTSNVFFGDYNDISAYDGRVRPIWTQLTAGKLSVWTAIIN